jgi:hypothetical protein
MMGAYDRVVQWARDGTLTFDLEQVPLSQIETAWQPTDLRGRRLGRAALTAPPPVPLSGGGR